jgi:hypothetical protein
LLQSRRICSDANRATQFPAKFFQARSLTYYFDWHRKVEIACTRKKRDTQTRTAFDGEKGERRDSHDVRACKR